MLQLASSEPPRRRLRQKRLLLRQRLELPNRSCCLVRYSAVMDARARRNLARTGGDLAPLRGLSSDIASSVPVHYSAARGHARSCRCPCAVVTVEPGGEVRLSSTSSWAIRTARPARNKITYSGCGKLQIDHRIRVAVHDLPGSVLEAEDYRGSLRVPTSRPKARRAASGSRVSAVLSVIRLLPTSPAAVMPSELTVSAGRVVRPCGVDCSASAK